MTIGSFMKVESIAEYKCIEICVKRSLSKRPKIVFKTDYRLMQVKSIAECSLSLWSILQYFWPALSDNQSWKTFWVFLRVAVLHRFNCTYNWTTYTVASDFGYKALGSKT